MKILWKYWEGEQEYILTDNLLYVIGCDGYEIFSTSKLNNVVYNVY